MNEAYFAASAEPAPQAATLVLNAALAHYFDHSRAAAASARSDDILRTAIAGELPTPR